MTVTNSKSVLRFQISPLIRITLLSLYVALTAPLPFLATVSSVTIPVTLLIVGLLLGVVL